nr:homocysteine S-methyltransferase family protein [uncultured Gemmiger sp.]
MTTEEIFARRRFVFLDGGLGTQLQKRGLQPGQKPELAAFLMPETLEAIHREYAAAGADILYANTFGANEQKLTGTGYTVAQTVAASIACARRAAQPYGALVALDIGPLGELLAPTGTLSFEDACARFAEIVQAGVQAGADLIVIETMTDLYELKAAILAARENSTLPVLASMSFESRGRTFTGCTVESFGITAAGLGVDAVGINCSLGPEEILPFAKRLCRVVPAGMPVFVKPNAGLPNPDGSYDLTADGFVEQMLPYAATGISVVGGCCGTTPEYIRKLREAFAKLTPAQKIPVRRSRLCTPVRCVEVEGITVVGERINPTGKKRLQQALREGDSGYACAQAVAQAEAGAQVLDVNAGLPGIDEAATLEMLVRELQAVTDLPLQLDSNDPVALERALRIYNGKPIVNSVNGEEKSLKAILPLCKKYGAAVVGLCLDENGIPKTAEGRFAVAQKIVAATDAAGIPREDVCLDCLTLTVSAEQASAVETLKAMRLCKQELGVRTVLGVSNISFGLPCRGYMNTTFLTLAMQAGLDLAIMNPNTPEMMAAVRAFRVLTSQDEQCADYVQAYAGQQTQTVQTVKAPAAETAAPAAGVSGADDPLADAVRRGLKKEARAAAEQALLTREPLEVVNLSLIPALDTVGDGFEKGTLFLPQLLQAATAAQAAFDVIKTAIANSGQKSVSKGKIVLATVKGDIHDIGKNIVRVVLENYGYEVTDLGRDVDPMRVVQAARETGAPLVGLSALMTTTVPSMQTTIEELHKAGLPCKVMVGGAVLTPSFAKQIGADFYAKDAKASADYAKQLFESL